VKYTDITYRIQVCPLEVYINSYFTVVPTTLVRDGVCIKVRISVELWLLKIRFLTPDIINVEKSSDGDRILLYSWYFSCFSSACLFKIFFLLFSSPDPKGHMRYCHHLASVVRPLTFSYFNLLLWISVIINGFDLLPKTCNFTICSIFSNSGHVCWPNGAKWRSFIEDLT
jgi:hypothetical protein